MPRPFGTWSIGFVSSDIKTSAGFTFSITTLLLRVKNVTLKAFYILLKCIQSTFFNYEKFETQIMIKIWLISPQNGAKLLGSLKKSLPNDLKIHQMANFRPIWSRWSWWMWGSNPRPQNSFRRKGHPTFRFHLLIELGKLF